MIQIQPYYLTVHYLPSSNVPVLHASSQLHLSSTDNTLHADIKVFAHKVANCLPVSYAKLQEIKDKTKLDIQLK